MAEFKLVINCDNAAFEDDPADEIARVLSRLATDESLAVGDRNGRIYDVNGDFIGTWRFTQ